MIHGLWEPDHEIAVDPGSLAAKGDPGLGISRLWLDYLKDPFPISDQANN
jgi:hypothetical protein